MYQKMALGEDGWDTAPEMRAHDSPSGGNPSVGEQRQPQRITNPPAATTGGAAPTAHESLRRHTRASGGPGGRERHPGGVRASYGPPAPAPAAHGSYGGPGGAGASGGAREQQIRD